MCYKCSFFVCLFCFLFMLFVSLQLAVADGVRGNPDASSHSILICSVLKVLGFFHIWRLLCLLISPDNPGSYNQINLNDRKYTLLIPLFFEICPLIETKQEWLLSHTCFLALGTFAYDAKPAELVQADNSKQWSWSGDQSHALFIW